MVIGYLNLNKKVVYLDNYWSALRNYKSYSTKIPARCAEATSCAELQRAAEASVQEAEALVVEAKQGGRNYTNHIAYILCF